jgi:hypothetical protein
MTLSLTDNHSAVPEIKIIPIAESQGAKLLKHCHVLQGSKIAPLSDKNITLQAGAQLCCVPWLDLL